MTAEPIRFRARVLQYPGMAPWFRVPARFIQAWGLTATTTVEGTLNGYPLGRRAIKDSGPKTDDWYMGLTKELAAAAGCLKGDEVEVELTLADMTLPAAMAERIAHDPGFAQAYAALSPGHRRKAIEHYLEARTEKGRSARLDKIDRSIRARSVARREDPA